MLRKLWLFVAMFALATFSSAIRLEDLNINGIDEYLHHGEKRQAAGTGKTPSPAAAASSNPPATSAAAPAASTPAPASSPAAASTPPKSNTPATSTAPAAPAQSTAENNQPSSTENNQSSSPHTTNAAAPATSDRVSSAPRTTDIVHTSALVFTSLQQFVTTYTTISDGQEVTSVSTGYSSVPITTGQALITDAPTSQENSGNTGNGLSSTNKSIIGGVVGGVGGALLLGGIALVFWRMKKRQTRVHEDDDDMTLGTGSALGDKPHSGHGTTPFQSNLEQYHNPGGRPNAAANF